MNDLAAERQSAIRVLESQWQDLALEVISHSPTFLVTLMQVVNDEEKLKELFETELGPPLRRIAALQLAVHLNDIGHGIEAVNKWRPTAGYDE